MDAATLLAEVRADNETALERLGSEKSLLAATEARLETDAVLTTTAAVLSAARDGVDQWAGTVIGNEAIETLETAAARLEEAYERVAAELDDADDTELTLASVDVPYLDFSVEGDVQRVAAATIALPLVLDRLFLQGVSFFVNEADNARADLFRDLRAMTDDLLAEGKDRLDQLCDEQGWDRASEAIETTIEAAYDDYVQRLDAMGFDPKPIC